jgi:Raf kinase inhibitor-like YbhB/YbcL family protein
MKVSSPSFKHNGFIPSKYTCDGKNVNPSLNLEGVPDNAESLVLIVDDPDAPMGTWVHWVVWNIPVTEKIDENSVPGTEGVSTSGDHSYSGPCPPSGTHRYFFKIYALDTKLDIGENSRKENVENAMEGHVVGKGEMIGLYKR